MPPRRRSFLLRRSRRRPRAPDALEELLAPIALYPDALLGQILAASVNSQEVLDAGNWLVENPDLEGKALDDATLKAGFGPAMRSLVHFRSVIDMMCQQIDWTRQVGSAFTSDQKSVLDAVQRLRAQAAVVGNLKTTPQQTVETKKENDKVYIEVQPADPQIVYVPTYDPQTVYTTPVYIEDDDDDDGSVAFAFTMGVMIGGMYSSYCYPYWGMSSVYIGYRPFYPPAYIYRPIYNPGFRPGYRYPAHHDYRYAYNRGDQVAHHDNYFDRFDGNKNLSGRTESPLQQPATGDNRVGQGGDKYAGRPDPATQERLGQAAGARDLGAGDRDLGATARDQGLDPMDRGQRVDRGYGESGRALENDLNRDMNRDLGGARPPPERLSDVPAVRDQGRTLDLSMPNITDYSSPRDGSFTAASQRDSAAMRDMGGGATYDRGGGASYDRSSVPSQRDSAFSGANQQRGSFDRAASARGHASAGSRGGSRGGGGRGR